MHGFDESSAFGVLVPEAFELRLGHNLIKCTSKKAEWFAEEGVIQKGKALLNTLDGLLVLLDADADPGE